MAEPFQSLYRRYRPQRFSELRGQDHVVLALTHAVRDERVAHAYLFSGPRGTGKTSTARILAKALNCQAPADGEPCGVCDSCREIAKGVSLDVHELDAASNNGVDAMRDLVARASLATPGKWKVYIVDEVHMLSTAAANALLKTLEEPPSHVVFVLATTDPQKVLPTIKSRTQHFEFHLLDPEVLEGLLSDIAADAKLELPTDAIDASVRRGHGSARDALSALDQVAAAGVVADDSRFVAELIAALAEPDTTKALSVVAEAVNAGLDAPRLAAELIDGLRGVFLGAIAPSSAGAATGPDGRPVLGPARSVRALEVVGAAIVDMREALDARTCFEVALVRLTHPEVDDSPMAIVDRLDRLERRLTDLAAAGPGAPAVPAAPAPLPGRPGPTGGNRPAAQPPTAAGSPALGAYRPAGRPPAPSGPPPAASPPPRPGGGAGGASGPPGRPAPASGGSAEPSPSALAGSPAAPAAGAAAPMPDRDDLVAAWGDHILSSLRAKPRAVFVAGRFVAVEDETAVFALPNSAHVAYAEPLISEVAGVLTAYFKRPIRLRLITDDQIEAGGADAARATTGEGSLSPEAAAGLVSSAPAPAVGVPDGSTSSAKARAASQPRASGQARGTARPGSGAPGEAPRPPTPAQRAAQSAKASSEPDYEDIDFEDLAPGEAAGNHDPVSWAATRLLEAFPGAEEVP